MHSTTYERMVEDFLLRQSPSMLVRPQYWLWAARKARAPDILAVDLRNRIFYLAEVTANKRPVQLLDKLQDYRDGEERILCGLKYAFGVTNTWSVVPWLFIWDGVKDSLKTAIEQYQPKTTYLNSLLSPSTKGEETLRRDWGQSEAERAMLMPEERKPSHASTKP